MFLIVTVRCCLQAKKKTSPTELKLPIGNYRIVTVGNTYHTEVSNGQSLATAQFCDKNCISGERIVGNDSLYYAYKEISIPGDAQQIKNRWILPVRTTKSMWK